MLPAALQAYGWVNQFRGRTDWPADLAVPWVGKPATGGATGAAGAAGAAAAGGPAGGAGATVTTGRQVPYMAVADFLGIDRSEAAAHIALTIWSLTHPNSAIDPQVGAACKVRQRVCNCIKDVATQLRCAGD